MLKNRTKKLLADGLESMLHEMPLEKVRINDLCERCDVQRQVFYYHFRDKYDLVAWVFEQDYQMGVDEAGSAGAQAQIAFALKHIWERRRFYRTAFADKSQNSIESYIQDFDVAMGVELAKRYLGVTALTESQLTEIKHNSYGAVGCTIEWVKGDLKLTGEQLAALEIQRMPKFLRESYEHAAAAGDKRLHAKRR